MKRFFSAYIIIALSIFAFTACEKNKDDIIDDTSTVFEDPIITEYGYILNDYNVVRDTIRRGDTFGDILSANGVSTDKIMLVATKFKDSFNLRRIVAGKPYVLLNSKDSTNTTQVFIYEPNKEEFAVVDFRNDVNCFTTQRPISYVERTASGIIEGSLSETMDAQNLSANMTDQLAKIYAWTVNFFKVQPGDRFKVVYVEKYIEDTIPGGVQEIKAAYFEHKGKPLYAFNFTTDSIKGVSDYYDDKAANLKRAFLKAPVKFSRISSKYNLNRRIAYYGYKLRPHRGTDFAAPIGTPILATSDGTVIKSERRGGNGNYVKIKHNSTYETQYLHMRDRKVKVGQHVSQGDVIGWVGMTGNTGGPHVCYRFWKNGKEIDPFKEDLPFSQPLAKEYQQKYFNFIKPLKDQIDCVQYN